ncbi:MAG: hypothetical protein ABSB58_07930 [Gemmatimonadales bacterium]
MFLNVGDSVSVRAVVKDEQGNTYDAGDAVWTSSVPAVAAVRLDSTYAIPFDAFSQAFIRAVTPGLSWVFVTTHGLTDSIQVYGVPLSFGGTVSVKAGPTIWDTLTVNSTAALGFNTSASSPSVVTIGGASTVLISRSATQIKVLPPVGAAGSTIAITNVMLLGVVQVASLNATTAAPAVTDIGEPANNTKAGAVSFGTLSATAAHPYVVQGYMTGTDVEDYYTFTLAAAAKIHGVLSWFGDGSGSSTSNPDLDVIICDATLATCDYNVDNNDLFGFSAATAVQPQSGTSATVPAGTYVVHVYGYTTPASGMMYQLALNVQ